MKKPIQLSDEVVNLLLPRLEDEFKAFYFYRAASNWCENVGYMKAAKFFADESASELEHAKGLEEFLVKWNVDPELPTIAKPKIEFKSLVEVIEKAYDIEYELYEEYEATSVKVFKSGDLCAFDLLQKYRTIQSDSVGEYATMLNIMDGTSADKFELLMLEKKLFK